MGWGWWERVRDKGRQRDESTNPEFSIVTVNFSKPRLCVTLKAIYILPQRLDAIPLGGNTGHYSLVGRSW